MLIIPGQPGKDLCDRSLGVTRRDLLRIGGSGALGLSLGGLFKLQAATANTAISGGPGWGKAKSIIMVYLQGGPSHLDLWDPKQDVPDNVRSVFKPISTKLPGVSYTELLPKLAQVNDKFTMIRSMSYTPNGLFNHTAAIYQMMTGYTTDKVSPSGQLEPPSPKDFPNFGSNIVKFLPVTEPMLPFVMLPRPLQESNVVGKGGTAGFLGRAYDPYTLYPDADDMDMSKMDKIKIDDLNLQPDIYAQRLRRRATRHAVHDDLRPVRVNVRQFCRCVLGSGENRAGGAVSPGNRQDRLAGSPWRQTQPRRSASPGRHAAGCRALAHGLPGSHRGPVFARSAVRRWTECDVPKVEPVKNRRRPVDLRPDLGSSARRLPRCLDSSAPPGPGLRFQTERDVPQVELVEDRRRLVRLGPSVRRPQRPALRRVVGGRGAEIGRAHV